MLVLNIEALVGDQVDSIINEVCDKSNELGMALRININGNMLLVAPHTLWFNARSEWDGKSVEDSLRDAADRKAWTLLAKVPKGT